MTTTRFSSIFLVLCGSGAIACADDEAYAARELAQECGPGVPPATSGGPVGESAVYVRFDANRTYGVPPAKPADVAFEIKIDAGEHTLPFTCESVLSVATERIGGPNKSVPCETACDDALIEAEGAVVLGTFNLAFDLIEAGTIDYDDRHEVTEKLREPAYDCAVRFLSNTSTCFVAPECAASYPGAETPAGATRETVRRSFPITQTVRVYAMDPSLAAGWLEQLQSDFQTGAVSP